MGGDDASKNSLIASFQFDKVKSNSLLALPKNVQIMILAQNGK